MADGLSDWWGQNAPSWLGGYATSGMDPSDFPVPPMPTVGAEPSPGGGAFDPNVASPSNWGQTGILGGSGGTNWTDVAAALKGLQGQAGGNAAAGQSSQTPQGVAAGSAQSQLGQPLHRVDPNSVLDVLHRRALGLQQGAMAGPRGQGWGDVQTPVPTTYGLLGY